MTSNKSHRFDSWNAWIALGVAILALTGFSTYQRGTAAAPGVATIRLSIDYGDGVEKRFQALPFKESMTVLDALLSAQSHPRGVKVSVAGTGANAMVVQIDDLKNEGGGPKSRNWLFRVNGKEATQGAGSLALSAGDAVLWKFTVYEYNADK